MERARVEAIERAERRTRECADRMRRDANALRAQIAERERERAENTRGANVNLKSASRTFAAPSRKMPRRSSESATHRSDYSRKSIAKTPRRLNAKPKLSEKSARRTNVRWSISDGAERTATAASRRGGPSPEIAAKRFRLHDCARCKKNTSTVEPNGPCSRAQTSRRI